MYYETSYLLLINFPHAIGKASGRGPDPDAISDSVGRIATSVVVNRYILLNANNICGNN